MTKEKKIKTPTKKKAVKKKTFKQQLIESNISKRISPTALGLIANRFERDEVLKEIIIRLNPFFAKCSIEDFLEISKAIEELRKGK